MTDLTADREEDLKWINDAAAALSRRFGAVQILCTRYDQRMQQTSYSVTGRGDFYARYGLAKAWVKTEEAAMLNSGGMMSPDESNGI